MNAIQPLTNQFLADWYLTLQFLLQKRFLVVQEIMEMMLKELSLRKNWTTKTSDASLEKHSRSTVTAVGVLGMEKNQKAAQELPAIQRCIHH